MKGFDFIATGNRWKKYGVNYLKEASEIYSKLNNNVRIIGTFLIGFNITWIQLFQQSLGPLPKTFIFVSILSLFLSIFFSLYTDRESIKFLNIVGRHYENKSDKLLKYIVQSQKSSGLSYPEHLWKKDDKKVKSEFNPWQGKISLFLFVIGFISSFVVGIVLLLGLK